MSEPREPGITAERASEMMEVIVEHGTAGKAAVMYEYIQGLEEEKRHLEGLVDKLLEAKKPVADYLKIPEVAHILGLSEKTIRRRVKAGEIPSVFIGGVYRISRADLDAYLELSKVRPGKVELVDTPQ